MPSPPHGARSPACARAAFTGLNDALSRRCSFSTVGDAEAFAAVPAKIGHATAQRRVHQGRPAFPYLFAASSDAAYAPSQLPQGETVWKHPVPNADCTRRGDPASAAPTLKSGGDSRVSSDALAKRLQSCSSAVNLETTFETARPSFPYIFQHEHQRPATQHSSAQPASEAVRAPMSTPEPDQLAPVTGPLQGAAATSGRGLEDEVRQGGTFKAAADGGDVAEPLQGSPPPSPADPPAQSSEPTVAPSALGVASAEQDVLDPWDWRPGGTAEGDAVVPQESADSRETEPRPPRGAGLIRKMHSWREMREWLDAKGRAGGLRPTELSRMWTQLVAVRWIFASACHQHICSALKSDFRACA